MMPDNRTSELGQLLLECAIACENCAATCLNDDNADNMKRCISLNLDCAAKCREDAKLLRTQSKLDAYDLQICEYTCRLCCEECGKYKQAHFKVAAAVCFDCAEACHEQLAEFQYS